MKIIDICEKYNVSIRGLYLNINKDDSRHTGRKPADMKKYYLAKAKEYQKKQITQQYVYTSSYGTDIKGFDSEIAMKVFAIKQLYKAVMEIPEEMAIEA